MMTNPLEGWGGFASLAIIAGCWQQVKALIARVRSLFVVQVTVQGDAARALSSYCLKNFKRSPIGDRFYRSGSMFVRPVSRIQEVAWERPPKQPLFLFDGWKPIIIGGYSHQDSLTTTEEGIITVTVIRWLTDSEALIIAALDDHNKLQGESNGGGTRYHVRRAAGRGRVLYDYAKSGSGVEVSPSSGNGPPQMATPDRNERFLKWEKEDLGPMKPESPMKAIALPPSILPAVEEFERWKESEAWFKSRQVPWRRGWLLHGIPGTGKTSFVRALAQQADMPIFSFDLSSLSNEEMTTRWRETQEYAPCIALFEDVDAVFEGRKNITGETGGGMTFDCLLNCLGGVETADGVFVMVTTNNIEKLDDALTRPGRLDRIIEMPSLPKSCLQQIADRILGEWPDEVEAVMSDADKLTGAKMTELCVSRALERYWKGPRS